MDKLSRQEQVWLSVFAAALVGPKHGFTDAYELAGAACRAFKEQFGEGEDARAPYPSLSKEEIESCPQVRLQEKYKDAVAAAAMIGDQRDEGFRRIQDLERQLELAKSNERAAVKCFREDLTRAHARIDNFEHVREELSGELDKANIRNFDLQKEFADFKENKDNEIQHLRNLLEEMTKSIAERDELISSLRSERNDLDKELSAEKDRSELTRQMLVQTRKDLVASGVWSDQQSIVQVPS